MKRKNENGLTEFEQRFSDLYLINPNATEAHIKAGFPGKSKLAHSVEGSKLLNNPNVQAYLDKRRQTIAEKVGLKQEDVLREVMSLAFSKITDYGSFGPDGFVMKSSNEIDAAKIGVIQSIKTTVTTIRGKKDEGDTVKTITEFKLWDKPSQLIKLGEHLNLFKDLGTRENPLNVNVNNIDWHRLTLDELARIRRQPELVLDSLATRN